MILDAFTVWAKVATDQELADVANGPDTAYPSGERREAAVRELLHRNTVHDHNRTTKE